MSADPILDEFRSLVSSPVPDVKRANSANSALIGTFGAIGSRHGQNQSAAPDSAPDATARSGYDDESGLPVDWLEGYRRLSVMRRPRAIPATTWTWLTAAAGELLTRWGPQLAALNWSAIEVFGVHYEEPMPHIADAGLLAHLVEHRKLEAIGPRSAALRLPDGEALRISRPLATAAGIVLAWDLTSGEPPRSPAERSA
jgi:hypothetical protein